jgi:hypothetical protein
LCHDCSPDYNFVYDHAALLSRRLNSWCRKGIRRLIDRFIDNQSKEEGNQAVPHPVAGRFDVRYVKKTEEGVGYIEKNMERLTEEYLSVRRKSDSKSFHLSKEE